MGELHHLQTTPNVFFSDAATVRYTEQFCFVALLLQFPVNEKRKARVCSLFAVARDALWGTISVLLFPAALKAERRGSHQLPWCPHPPTARHLPTLGQYLIHMLKGPAKIQLHSFAGTKAVGRRG